MLFTVLYPEADTRSPLSAPELLTPPLEDVILPGVTRDSILSLARDHVSGKLKIPGLPDNLVVNERHITMKEVKEAGESGRLLEVFGAGTSRHLIDSSVPDTEWIVIH